MIGMIPTHTLYLKLRVIWGTKSFLRDCVRVCVRGGVLECVRGRARVCVCEDLSCKSGLAGALGS